MEAEKRWHFWGGVYVCLSVSKDSRTGSGKRGIEMYLCNWKLKAHFIPLYMLIDRLSIQIYALLSFIPCLKCPRLNLHDIGCPI